MKFTPREIFGILLMLLSGLLSLGFWKSFFDTSLRPDASNTMTVLLWSLFLGAVFSLGAVVWKKRSFQIIGTLATLVPSALFIHTWYHIGLLSLSGFLVFLSIRFVQTEIEDRLQFHFFRNVRAGSLTFVFALSLVLSSAYFASIRTESWEALVPRFSVGEGTATALFRTIAYFYPEWKKLGDEGVTVDEFLLSLKENKKTDAAAPESRVQQGDPASLPLLTEYLRQNSLDPAMFGDESFSEELYLRAGRDQIAALVGRPISGEEKIADVFSLSIQNKIITVLNGDQAFQHVSPTIVPFILSLLLFLTLLPIGSTLALFWVVLGLMLFRIALFFGWIKMEKMPKEQETLAP